MDVFSILSLRRYHTSPCGVSKCGVLIRVCIRWRSRPILVFRISPPRPSFIFSIFIPYLHSPPNLNSTMAIIQPDLILRIQHPLLNEVYPGNSTELILLEQNNHSKWRVKLTRANDVLKIAVTLDNTDGHSIKGDYVHVIPMNGSKPMLFDFSDKALPGDYSVSCNLAVGSVVLTLLALIHEQMTDSDSRSFTTHSSHPVRGGTS